MGYIILCVFIHRSIVDCLLQDYKEFCNDVPIFSSVSLVLTTLWIGSISCAVHHIVSSPDHRYPVESCLSGLTLSSFAANVSQYLDSNSLLLFQPGNHIIHLEVNITVVVNFPMTSFNPIRAVITYKNDSKPRFIVIILFVMSM
jgi:hypothetical protein